MAHYTVTSGRLPSTVLQTKRRASRSLCGMSWSVRQIAVPEYCPESGRINALCPITVARAFRSKLELGCVSELLPTCKLSPNLKPRHHPSTSTRYCIDPHPSSMVLLRASTLGGVFRTQTTRTACTRARTQAGRQIGRRSYASGHGQQKASSDLPW